MIIVETPHTGPYNVWSASSKQDFIKIVLSDRQGFADFCYNKNIPMYNNDLLCENCKFQLAKDFLRDDLHSLRIYNDLKEVIADYKEESRKKCIYGTGSAAWTWLKS